MQIIGGIETEDNGGAVIHAANSDSYWYGKANDGPEDVAIDFSNGATWVPVDYDSNRSSTSASVVSIGTVNLHDGGIVDLSMHNMDNAPDDARRKGSCWGTTALLIRIIR